MKKVLKFFGFFLLLVGLSISGLLIYLKFFLPTIEKAPEMKIELTQERIARGKYLAYHVAACMDCHSERDWTKFSGPLKNGTIGKGGELFDQKFGFPGSFVSANITPFHLKDWTDGEIYRAITCGVNKNGKALFPVMPYQYYGKMDEEDIKSIIAYVRTIPEISYQPSESKADFPMNFIINTIPQKQKAEKKPSNSDTLAFGAYLVNAAGCAECHTKQDKGQKLKGMEFAGGFDFVLPSGGTVRSPNITPSSSGLANWDRNKFVNRFKAYADSSAQNIKINQNEFNTVMPWTMYAGMTEEDLTAIFKYLQTIPAIENKVVRFTPTAVNN